MARNTIGAVKARSRGNMGDGHDGRALETSVCRGGKALVLVLLTAAVVTVQERSLARAQAPAGSPRRDAAAASKKAVDTPRAPATQEPATVTADALSLRYRFIEKYSVTEDANRPELITQYRVGLRETQRVEREKAQGAPDRTEVTHQTIYTERAAQVSKLGEIVAAVRRYDRFQKKEVAPTQAARRPVFEGLTVWLQRQSGRKPQVLSLTSDRPLREIEYSDITKQVLVPQLTALLPPTPRRVGDSWPISRQAAQCLVAELPDANDYQMTGTLSEMRKTGPGTTVTAIIGISGQMNLSIGLSALNAQIQFTFNPPALPDRRTSAPNPSDAPDGSSPKPRKLDEGIVDARGRITRLLMLWAVSDLIPEGEGRLKQTVTYELNLERRFPNSAGEAAGGQNAPLVIPDPPPKANESNSWVLHEDPEGRFYFLHPQNLALSGRAGTSNFVELTDQDPGAGQDVLTLMLPPGDADPQADRKFRDPKQFDKTVDADWAKRKVETLRGPAEWLPEANWAPWKVYRKELAVKTPGSDDTPRSVQRIFIDNYLVLSKRNECFQVQSMTVRDDHVAFRTQAESIIKSFRFGAWNGKPAVASSSPAPAAPPTTP